MPLVRIDAVAGRTPQEITALLDAAHRAVLSAFKVPQRDRYQIFHEHPAHCLVLEDTGLSIPRTSKAIVVTITSMPRAQDLKLQLYQDLCRELKSDCNIDPSDVIVSIVTNSAPDWSFGNARAQFITGEL